jgi:hypothetical protein
MRVEFNSVRYLLILLCASLIFSLSCRKEVFTDNPSARLTFETDTLQFDTIFTSVGSATHIFKAYNPNSESIRMDIYLAGGEKSPFRLNIDGRPTKYFKDYEFPGKDSIYLFAEVTIDPVGGGLPMVVQDSIIFEFNGNRQRVILEAFGQDVHLINQDTVCNTNWINDKPYLINRGAIVPKGCKLTMNPGVKVFCHQGSYLLVYGQLEVKGTVDKPVTFTGDRTEKAYEHVAGQWHGIILAPGSNSNTIEHAVIENGNVGVEVDSLPNSGGYNLRIEKTIIRHMASYGLHGQSSVIHGKNLLVHDCGRFTFLGDYGGDYDFVNCTFDNTHNAGSRKLPSVVLTNRDIQGYPPNNIKGVFLNSIIWGSLEDEVGFDLSGVGTNAFTFQYNILKLKSLGTFDPTNIIDKSPKFKSSQKGDYRLDTLSSAINAGRPFAAPYDVTDDLENKPRIANPDMGCFERE